MSVHDLIRRARKAKNLTEKQLADLVGVSRSAVQQWEREGGTAPSRRHMDAVARALDLTPTELAHGWSHRYPTDQRETSAQAAREAERDAAAIEAAKRTEKLLWLFASLDDGRQNMALSYMEFLVSSKTPGKAAEDGNYLEVPGGKKAA